MEAATSNLQHSFGLGPQGPNLNPKLGAELASPGPPRPEEQHHKPFFYIQPSQPYLPMQWPVTMPVSYNPYYGYPGLGLGLPMMPQYQPNPYMEPPGFVVPHTHLHLMDYRRMLNSQYYHTMAYHARRFRYQHNSASKEMTSSEVQTEPLLSVYRISTPRSSDCATDDASSSVATGQLQSPVPTVQMEDHLSELQEKGPSSTTGVPSNSSFVIQTEEVRIECCSAPVGLQLLHAHEAAEMPQRFSQDLVQCGSPTQSGILQDEIQTEQELSVCPDILLVGKPNTGEKNLSQEEPMKQMDPMTASEAEETSTDEDLSATSKSFHYKVVQVPFGPTYLDELRKMESTVWSAEESFMTSPVQNTFIKASNKTLNASPEINVLEMVMLTNEAPTKEIIVTEIPPLAEIELEEIIPTVEKSEANICPASDASPPPELPNTTEVTLSTNVLLLDNFPLPSDINSHQQLETTNDQDHQNTSFESLPAYLPSTSWISDFDHSYHCRKMPLASIKQNRPRNLHGLDVPKRRRKLDVDYKEQLNVRKPKERYNLKGKVDRQSLSDHECCRSRNLNENVLSSRWSKNERLCSRCTAKRRISTSPSSVCESQSLKRKAVPFQEWNDVLLPTCETCKSHTKRQLMRKGFNPDLCSPHYGHDTECDSSGNSSCRTGPKWRAVDNSRKLQDIKRPLVTKSPVAIHTMLRQSNCVRDDLQNQSVGWEKLRRCPHGNTIREIDENCNTPVSLEEKWRNPDQMYLTHRRQTAPRSWRDTTFNTYNGRFLKEATSQHFINHKKTQPQPQGIHTKETRC